MRRPASALGVAGAVALFSQAASSRDASASLPYWVDFSRFTLIQTWLYDDTTASPARPNFNIRRAQLGLSGQPAEGASWFIMVDAAKIPGIAVNPATGQQNPGKDLRILQDIGVSFTLFPGFEALLGQFKVQTDAEALAPTTELPLPERSLVSRTFGDRREPGAMLSYRTGHAHASLMLSNGQGPNVDDVDGSKDLSARLEWALGGGWSAGAFTQASNFSYGTHSSSGANVWYSGPDLFARAEGAVGISQGTSTSGFTVDAGYRFLERFQPVARFELLEPPTAGADNAHAFSFGLNYFFAGYRAKAQLSFTALSNMSAATGSPVYQAGSSGAVTVLSFQGAL